VEVSHPPEPKEWPTPRSVGSRDWSESLPPFLTCLSSPCRAGDIQSSPRAGRAGRANSARLDGGSGSGQIVISKLINSSADACPDGCECGARAKTSSKVASGSLHIEPKTHITKRAVARKIDFVSVSQKAPSGRFMRRPLNLNSHNHNQRDRRRRFYLAVLIGHNSRVVLAIVVLSLCYSNPFWRSPQYAIPHRSRVLMRRAVFRAH
jgi:hypothetical protein